MVIGEIPSTSPCNDSVVLLMFVTLVFNDDVVLLIFVTLVFKDAVEVLIFVTLVFKDHQLYYLSCLMNLLFTGNCWYLVYLNYYHPM